MITNQWYVVFESNEVKSRPVGVTRLGEILVFWRNDNGIISAAVDRCPHREVVLSVGQILSYYSIYPSKVIPFSSTL
ncbi:MAG: Rieske 2Fe-2S domain-containing protein [Anaerolineaceae bacterium]